MARNGVERAVKTRAVLTAPGVLRGVIKDAQKPILALRLALMLAAIGGLGPLRRSCEMTTDDEAGTYLGQRSYGGLWFLLARSLLRPHLVGLSA
jgi:hypothetical protein